MEFKETTTFKSKGTHWTIVEAREATKEEVFDYELNELMKVDKEELAMIVMGLRK